MMMKTMRWVWCLPQVFLMIELMGVGVTGTVRGQMVCQWRRNGVDSKDLRGDTQGQTYGGQHTAGS